MTNFDSDVHKGHRARMRRKLREYGGRIFDTYELLEMLLYYVIPFKDTNPVAKELLNSFGSPEGIFHAKDEDLTKINGIKDKCCEFISDVGKAPEMCEISSCMKPKLVFDDYRKAGEYFVNHFEKNKNNNILLILLDNGMRLIKTELIKGENFGSGAVQPRYFLDVAMRHGASLAIVGYTHRNGYPFPYEADLLTGKLIREELSLVGVSLVEQYVVGGNRFIGINTDTAFKQGKSRELSKFLESRKQNEENTIELLKSSEEELKKSEREQFPVLDLESDESIFRDVADNYYDCRDFAVKTAKYLSKILSYSIKNGDTNKIASDLLIKYGSLDTVLDRSVEELEMTDGVDENTSTLIKLIAYISSRRVQDNFKFGKTHTDDELYTFITSLYTGLSVETVFLTALDEKNRVIGCEYIGEGTVNSSDVFPRKLAERAVKMGAKVAIISHNHPGGTAKPSNADIVTTARLVNMFRSFGIKLEAHVVVAERHFTVLKKDEQSGEIRVVTPYPC